MELDHKSLENAILVEKSTGIERRILHVIKQSAFGCSFTMIFHESFRMSGSHCQNPVVIHSGNDEFLKKKIETFHSLYNIIPSSIDNK